MPETLSAKLCVSGLVYASYDGNDGTRIYATDRDVWVFINIIYISKTYLLYWQRLVLARLAEEGGTLQSRYVSPEEWTDTRTAEELAWESKRCRCRRSAKVLACARMTSYATSSARAEMQFCCQSAECPQSVDCPHD